MTIIKHYHEKRYTACKICKDNPEKHWGKTSLRQTITRFGTMERQNGIYRP